MFAAYKKLYLLAPVLSYHPMSAGLLLGLVMHKDVESKTAVSFTLFFLSRVRKSNTKGLLQSRILPQKGHGEVGFLLPIKGTAKSDFLPTASSTLAPICRPLFELIDEPTATGFETCPTKSLSPFVGLRFV